MTALADLLAGFRAAAVTEREKGTYFEELIVAYLRHEASYKDLYSDVWTFADWAKAHGKDAKDTGIDLVAKTRDTEEFHAIQCKFFAADHKIQKSDIDSFFTASGKKPFKHRLIVCSTDHWSDNAEAALLDQQVPVNKITLYDLESSQLDWAKFKPSAKGSPALRAKKSPRAHQRAAIEDVLTGLKKADRGKLLMACGTGKTYTALKLAERQAGAGKRVLFLVPSLSLLSQSLTEWTQESEVPLHSFAVCSDSDVGKKKAADDDSIQTFTHELRFPATTNAKRLAEEFSARHDSVHMSVVFSTYHSIDVVHRAQKQFGVPSFDLIICDEAHRTTGATWDGEDESAFVKVHDNDYIVGRKRLYMTATPRIYGNAAKATADKDNVTLASMDDATLFGEELHRLSFSDAVQRDLLVDYKVIVLAIEESHVNKRLQSLLADPNNQLKVADASKIVGCWKALAKQGFRDWGNYGGPMRRAVAFCQVIKPITGTKKHKVSSMNIAAMFQAVVEDYQKTAPADEGAVALRCEAQHVDGGMNAGEKEAKLAWLKAETPADTCRILSNVRCLSEGVDVPALDAVLFLTPRNSQVDVVQSVGRVMRKAPGKELGYVVLPVVIPAGMTPNDALDNNEVYKVVWQVLQALRSHDDRFDAMVNKMDLMNVPPSKMEVIAVTDRIQPKPKQPGLPDQAKKQYGLGTKPKAASEGPKSAQVALEFEIGEIERAIYAKLVQKVGNRQHWEQWANDIAKIAQTHIDRITELVKNPKHKKERAAFTAFATELRDDLNDSITDAEVIEMLAQHLITKPVFDAIFAGHGFADRNPISVAMQKVLDVLHEHHLEKETDTLRGFYASVKMRAEGIDTAAGRQKIVLELYDKFFRGAFPKLTERLGIVYTPVEVVDFIIHSVAHLLEKEFGQSLGSEGVHILDPFTGTGTFITRLLQSGLIPKEQLARKYRKEIHANEIVLLAYYIAGVNIESVYHDIMEASDYEPFPGILLTDTFQMYEKEDLLSELLVDNSDRRKRQKNLEIRVIVGNPPYSAGQSSANDANQNVEYPSLDARIGDTYAAKSTATLKNKLYDSYVRAIRWSSDRVGESGIVGFVTNASFLDSSVSDGIRKCLVEEYSSIYVFHLRGNQRTQGELSRKEGGKVFGGGSRAPIAISLFVKSPKLKRPGEIHFHDIGDYLDRARKLEIVRELRSVRGVTEAGLWRRIVPNSHGDWLNQRAAGFEKLFGLGDKRGGGAAIFENYSAGVLTSRDAWAFNAGKSELGANMNRMISFYNAEVGRFAKTQSKSARTTESEVVAFVDKDATKISWDGRQFDGVAKGRTEQFRPEALRKSLYRPFTKSWLYFDRSLNARVYQLPKLFPRAESENRVICVSGVGASTFGVLMADSTPCFDLAGKTQAFPLFVYDSADFEESESGMPQLGFGPAGTTAPARRLAITDVALAHFKAGYPSDHTITKESIFYYCYGILHHPEYLEQYADNLSKELPRIPRLKSAENFWKVHDIGKALGDMHVGYEQLDLALAKVVEVDTGGKKLRDTQYRVEKMRYGKKDGAKDLTTIQYNQFITVRNIPARAYDYVINGRSAIDWVVERQGVRTDKDSGIVNDSNDWATETMKNPKYPLELLLRVIALSVETLRLVGELPKLDVLET